MYGYCAGTRGTVAGHRHASPVRLRPSPCSAVLAQLALGLSALWVWCSASARIMPRSSWRPTIAATSHGACRGGARRHDRARLLLRHPALSATASVSDVPRDTVEPVLASLPLVDRCALRGCCRCDACRGRLAAVRPPVVAPSSCASRPTDLRSRRSVGLRRSCARRRASVSALRCGGKRPMVIRQCGGVAPRQWFCVEI